MDQLGRTPAFDLDNPRWPILARSAEAHDVSFLDFSSGEHAVRFKRGRGDHFAVDGLHPNSSSYSYGYAAARRIIGKLEGKAHRAAAGRS